MKRFVCQVVAVAISAIPFSSYSAPGFFKPSVAGGGQEESATKVSAKASTRSNHRVKSTRYESRIHVEQLDGSHYIDIWLDALGRPAVITSKNGNVYEYSYANDADKTPSGLTMNGKPAHLPFKGIRAKTYWQDMTYEDQQMLEEEFGIEMDELGDQNFGEAPENADGDSDYAITVKQGLIVVTATASVSGLYGFGASILTGSSLANALGVLCLFTGIGFIVAVGVIGVTVVGYWVYNDMSKMWKWYAV